MFCPMIKEECVKKKCEWFVSISQDKKQEVCAIKLIAIALYSQQSEILKHWSFGVIDKEVEDGKQKV